jgi:hypothetical protein
VEGQGGGRSTFPTLNDTIGKKLPCQGTVTMVYQ